MTEHSAQGTPSQSPSAKSVFNDALKLLPELRAEYIERACRGDDALRGEVEELLAVHEGGGPFLRSPTAKVAAPHSTQPAGKPGSPPPDPLLGIRIGAYKPLELIGEGGFGAVYMAQQDEPVRRRVALKVLKPGMDSRMISARFEAERQALALMDHPHIARIFDGGVTDAPLGARPYFVMEYVKGDPVIDFADAHKLGVRGRLELFAQVCQAVQHAHSKGVIHRDIKPRNVLVSMSDGRPFAKVIDFCIAKATGSPLTEKTLFTEHRQLIGTPEYMSPEQAEGSPDIDTRTDVYALGVLLYELLTGATPFDARRLRSAEFAEMQRIIREEEPPAPSVRLVRDLAMLAATAAARQAEPAKLGPMLKGDLDWIVMKALEKDRARRYETPHAMAQDIQRHLSGEPILAAPPGAAYRLRKFVRKHRAAVVTTTLVAAALVLGIVGTTWQARRVQVEATRTAEALANEREARVEADHGAYVANFAFAQSASDAGDWPAARKKLALCPERMRGFEWNLLHQEAQGIIRSFPNVSSARFSPNGEYVYTHDRSTGLIQSWDCEGERRAESVVSAQPHRSHYVSPDGARLILRSDDDTAWRLFDVNGRPVGPPIEVEVFDSRCEFNADGKRLLIIDRDQVRVYNSDGVLLGRPIPIGRKGSFVFSPDGGRVFCQTESNAAQLWSSDGTLMEDFRLMDTRGPVHAVFAPDGRVILCWSMGSRAAQLFDMSGRGTGPPLLHEGRVQHALFSGDGKTILTLCSDRRAYLWDSQGAPACTPIFHDAALDSACFSPDGSRIMTWCEDGSAHLWDTRGMRLGQPLRHRGRLEQAEFSPDGKHVLTVGRNDGVRLWSSLGEPMGNPAPETVWAGRSAVFSQDGAQLFIRGSESARLRNVYDPLDDEVEFIGGDNVRAARLNHDATRALIGFGYLDLDSPTGTELRDTRCFVGTRRNLSPDPFVSPLELAAFRAMGMPAGGDTTAVPHGGPVEPSALLAPQASAVSPDGTRRAAVTPDGRIAFETPDGRREVAVFRQSVPVRAVEFAANGWILLVHFSDSWIQAWDARDCEARRASQAAGRKERALAAAWVDELLATPQSIQELESVIREAATLTASRRFAAATVLRAREEQISLDADSELQQLCRDHIMPARVRSAAAGRTDLPPRVLKSLQAKASEWNPDANRLNEYAWYAVQSPGAAQERLEAAMEAAAETVRRDPLESDFVNTLGATQYRNGLYEEALVTLARSREVDIKEGLPQPSGIAFTAMSHFKLGNVEEAKAKLTELHAMLSARDSEWSSDIEQAWSLLDEAESLISSTAAAAPAAPSGAPGARSVPASSAPPSPEP